MASDYLNVIGNSGSGNTGKAVLGERARAAPEYQDLAREYAAPLTRLARAYEADPDLCRDLLQDIHLALWNSLRSFDHRCSSRTWVYRVAHNVGASHILKRRRERQRGLISLDATDGISGGESPESYVNQSHARTKLMELVRRLKPLDRQVILLYLEDLDAASIGEVTGLSAANAATKIHRIKRILIQRFHKGGNHV